MNRRWFLLGAAALVVVGSAEARMHAPYRGHHIVPGGGAPLDGFTQPSGAYSFRKLRSVYTGPAIRLRRASDNAELDINFLGYTSFTGAPWNEAAAVAHCSATTCFVSIWNDQSGLARDLVQATVGAQPQLIFNCNGSLPCLRLTASTINIQTAVSLTPATGIMSFSMVAKRSSGTGPCTFIRFGTNRTGGTNGSANSWNTFATSALVATAADGVWHAAQSVNNGASSVIRIDATETTGTTGAANLTANAMAVLGGTGATCDVGEGLAWDNVANDVTARGFLASNQKAFWGTP